MIGRCKICLGINSESCPSCGGSSHNGEEKERCPKCSWEVGEHEMYITNDLEEKCYECCANEIAEADYETLMDYMDSYDILVDFIYNHQMKSIVKFVLVSDELRNEAICAFKRGEAEDKTFGQTSFLDGARKYVYGYIDSKKKDGETNWAMNDWLEIHCDHERQKRKGAK